MQTDNQKPIQGWKAASIMLGVAGFVLLAAWAMTSSDRKQSIAATNNTGQTVGVAPSPRTAPSQ